MKKESVKVIIIGIGNVGFSIIRGLNESDLPIDIIAISRNQPSYLKFYLENTKITKTIKFVKADIFNEKDINRLQNDVSLNNVNILISTIGTLSDSIEFDRFKNEFDINFYGNLIPIKLFINRITTNANNRIILLSSTIGNKAPNYTSAYSCSKWALENFASALQLELVNHRIYLDIIRPTNIINEYSKVFKFNNGVSAKNVADKVIYQIKLSVNNSSKKGIKIFVPKYFYGIRILERVFPNVLNYMYKLKPSKQRRKKYKKYKIKKILITGASSGLGRELAILYSSSVNEMTITGRDEKKIIATKKEIIKNSNCQVNTRVIDFERLSDVKKFVSNNNEFDLVINNAGQYSVGFVEDFNIQDYKRILNSNFHSPVLITSSNINSNRIKKVINIISTSAIAGKKSHSAYSASKSALWAFTRSLRRSFGNKIQILEVIPSTFKSSLFRNYSTKNKSILTGELLESKEIARKIYNAERKGKDILFIPYKSRLYLLLETLCFPLFKKMFL